MWQMGSMLKALLLHTKVQWLSQGRVPEQLSELQVELAVFFLKHKFHLKEWMKDKLWLFKLGYLKDIFSKNEASPWLQGKQGTESVVNDIQIFKLQSEFWKLAYTSTMNMKLPNT